MGGLVAYAAADIEKGYTIGQVNGGNAAFGTVSSYSASIADIYYLNTLSADSKAQAVSAAQLQELADAFMGDVQQVDMSPEDLDKLKKKHRSDELREIMEADMKYLKAMINKLERERQEISTESFTNPSVTLEISGIEMPVTATQAPPVTPEGEVIDVSL